MPNESTPGLLGRLPEADPDGNSPGVAGAAVEGRVLRATDGAAVPGATVIGMRLDSQWRRSRPKNDPDVEVVSDELGRYSVSGLVPGVWMLVAWSSGYATEGLRPIPGGYNPLAFTASPGHVVRQDIRVVESAVLSGRVQQPSGLPASGATIVLQSEPTWPLVPGGIPGAELCSWALPGMTVTADEEGRFRVDTLSAVLNYRISARSEPWFPTLPVDLQPNSDRSWHVSLPLLAPRYVDVEVRDCRDGKDARLVAGAEIRVSRADRPPFGFTRDPVTGGGSGQYLDGSYQTGPDGRARIGPVPDSAITVSAKLRVGSESAWPSGHSNVEPGATSTVIRCGESMSLMTADDPAALDLTLRVVGPGREPAERFSAICRSGTDPASRWFTEAVASVLRERRRVRPSAIEVFDFRDARGAPLGWAPVEVDVLDRAELSVSASPGRSVAGFVRRSDGTPVAGTVVSARPARWSELGPTRRWAHSRAWTSQDGRFVLGGLALEDYQLAVVAGDKVVGGPFTISAETSHAVLVLRATTSSAVRVLDGRGQPVVGADVAVGPRASEDPERRIPFGSVWVAGYGQHFLSHARTDSAGVARLGSLDPERSYDLAVQAPGVSDDDARALLDGWRPSSESTVCRLGYARGDTLVVRAADAALVGATAGSRRRRLA